MSRKNSDQTLEKIRDAELLSDKDPNTALDQLTNVLAIAIEEDDRDAEAHCYKLLGKINLKQGFAAKASENFRKSLEIFQELKELSEAYQVRKLFADALEADKEFLPALKEWERVLQEAEKEGLINDAVAAKTNIARIYEKQGKLEEALKNNQEVLKIEEKRGNSKGVISANNRIGDIYLKQEKTDEALSHYSKSQNLSTALGDVKEITESNEMLGKVYRKEKRYSEELAIRMNSIALNKKSNNREQLGEEYLEVGKLYLEQENTSNAINYLNESLNHLDKSGKLDKKIEAYKYLSDAHSQDGNLKEALRNSRRYASLLDTMYKRKEKALGAAINFNETLGERQKKIESLEKDRELDAKTIELLRKDQKLKEEEMTNQAIVIYSLIGGLVLVLATSYLLYKSAQKRRIANQLLALKSLRSQMNPHFIFNALNSVNSFISQNDERSANKYLSDFSKLMRAVMENSQHDFVPLSSEIKILELYLSLEHFRFREKFYYMFNVDPAVDADSIQIPPMLIQPYIENAVWHGLRYKEQKGMLSVKIFKESHGLQILVEDDGIGRKRSQELKTNNQKETVSTGLRNIESRIKIINEIHKLKLSVLIEDREDSPNTGTRVRVKIPFQTKETVAL